MFNPNDVHIMLDLETLDTEPTAAIVSIGAVAFSPLAEPGKLAHESNPYFLNGVLSTFHRTVQIADAMNYGTVNGHTVQWWLHQSDAARNNTFNGSESLPMVLTKFSFWVSQVSAPARPQIWCNPAHFDFTILSYAYSKTGIPPGWNFRAGRCYRTLRHMLEPMMGDIKFEEPKIKHDALQDAIAQAKHMQKLVNRLSVSLLGVGKP